MPLTRRGVLGALAGLGAGLTAVPAWSRSGGPPHFCPSLPFDYGWLTDQAKQLAAKPYRKPVIAAPERLAQVDYDAHWQIRFRDDAALYPAGPGAPVQMFHPGRFFQEPVRIFQVDGGQAKEVIFDSDYFTMPADSPAVGLPPETGFAGFRVMRPGLKPDWISFLGASYFRTDGPNMQYGLSARGLAINTGLPEPEEFPRFSAFWFGPPEVDGDLLTAWALLESPSATGAYRFGLSPEGAMAGQTVTVEARLFLRQQVERLGIAPLTSMYWFSERDRLLVDEWRPEIHDSDGLALHTGAGERIWRPLQNPKILRTSSFFDRNPRGFGLIQRDRNFDHYQDDGVFYNRRPSAWIEPLGEWGSGAVQLIEIPTTGETFDNIGAYWLPESVPEPGSILDLSYKIHWTDQDPDMPGGARVTAVRQGRGGPPGHDAKEGIDKLVVDYAGESLAGLTVESGIEPVIEIGRGQMVGAPAIRPIVGTDGWRLSFDFKAESHEPAEIRAWLRHGGKALTETLVVPANTDRTA